MPITYIDNYGREWKYDIKKGVWVNEDCVVGNSDDIWLLMDILSNRIRIFDNCIDAMNSNGKED